MTEVFETIVAGVTQNNPDGKSRQKIIKDYVKEYCDTNRFDRDDYDYWSNKEIEEYGWDVYQYELFEEGTIDLIPEPDNPHDKNAIKVVHKNMGHIGYIPRKDNVKLFNFLEKHNNEVELSMKLEGGPYKYLDIDRVEKDSKPYYLRIYVESIDQISKKTGVKYTTIDDYASISSDYHYNDDILSNQRNTINEDPKKDKVIKKKESDIKYLIACCFGLLVSIMLLMLDSYFGFAMMMILSMLSLRFYFKPPQEDKK